VFKLKNNTGQRRNEILQMLAKQGKLSVAELSERFNISEVTIRSDLSELEQGGLLRRVHGGAVSSRVSYEMSLIDRMDTNKDAKMAIAKACAGLISDGDSLMIDSGTTTQHLARELAERSNLTIVTNSILIAQEFILSRSIDVILLGGNMDAQHQFTFGNDAVAQLSKYRVNKTIIATDGICAKHGLTTYHHQELDVSRLMIERSNEVIVVADSSKIGKEGFSNIVSASSIDVLVTNKCPENSSQLTELRQLGIKVLEA